MDQAQVKQEELLLEMKAERLIKRGGTRHAPARLLDPADPRLWAHLDRLCEERRKEKEQENSRLKQEATGGDDGDGVEDENQIRGGPLGDLAARREERRRRYREEG